MSLKTERGRLAGEALRLRTCDTAFSRCTCVCVCVCVCFQMNVSDRGAQCNRAIMVITDGAPDTYEEIFANYNWPNKSVRTRRLARLSTAKREFFLREDFLPAAQQPASVSLWPRTLTRMGFKPRFSAVRSAHTGCPKKGST